MRTSSTENVLFRGRYGRSSTSRSEREYRMYIITARRTTSDEPLT